MGAEIAAILFILLLIVTLVGHAIWVILAWLFRGGRPANRTSWEPTLSDDRAATLRYLRHLEDKGQITPQEYAELTRLVSGEAQSEDVMLAMLTRKAAISTKLSQGTTAAGSGVSTAPPAVTQPSTPKVQPPKPAPVIPPNPPLIREAVPLPAATASPPKYVGPPPPPPTPRRPFTAILAGFMAEKNIRWGEIIGGLLILCCSTALVISLWSRIEAIPVLKFVIFTAVTAALFGAGLFVHHRWRLPTTGHAVLIVSTLLVPLNLVAFAAFSRGSPSPDWTLGVEAGAAAIFTWLVLLAGRVLVAEAAVRFTCGVMGLSAYCLVARFLPAAAGPMLSVLPPVALYLGVMGLALWQTRRTESITDHDAPTLFIQLGVLTFACITPIALQVYGLPEPLRGLKALSPFLCAVATPALGVGVLLWRRVTAQQNQQLRTAGMSIALIAIAAMLLGLGLGWPVPVRIMPTLLVITAAAAALAAITGSRGLHAATAACFSLAWVLVTVVVFGPLGWSSDSTRDLLQALFSTIAGATLLAPFAACVLVADWLRRRERTALSNAYALTGCGIAAVSLALLTAFGFGRAGDPGHVVWPYLLYSAAAFAVAWRIRSAPAVWVGCTLLQAAAIQGLVYAWPLEQFAAPTALLAGASASAAASICLNMWRTREERSAALTKPLAQFAVLTSAAAALWILLAISPAALPAGAVRIAWVALLWAALSATYATPLLFAAAQVAITLAGGLGLHAWLQHRSWCPSTADCLREPWVWQAHLLLIAAAASGWTLARRLVTRARPDGMASRPTVAGQLLAPAFPPADRWLSALALCGAMLLGGWSVYPSLAPAYGLQPTPGQSALHAAGGASWAVLVLTGVVLLLRVSEGLRLTGGVGLIALAAAAVALLSARLESAAIALRTGLSAAFLLASVAIWVRRKWVDRAQRILSCRVAREPLSSGQLTVALFAILAAPAVGLLLKTSLPAAGGLSPGLHEVLCRLSLLGPAALLCVALLGYGVAMRQPHFALAASILACAVVTRTESSILARAATFDFTLWLAQLNVIVFAGVAATWVFIRYMWPATPKLPQYPRAPLLIPRGLLVLLLLGAMAMTWVRPLPVPSIAAAMGSVWGLAAVVLTECVLLLISHRRKGLSGYTASVWAVSAAILAACALAPLDSGNWLCFHAMMVAFVVLGGLRLCLGSRQIGELVGAGWRQTLDTAVATAGGQVGEIEHHLACASCGYDLHGLGSQGQCPECGTPNKQAVDVAMERLTPAWAGRLAETRWQASAAVLALIGLSTAFALRAALNDPQRPWWSAAVLTGLAGLALALAAWEPRRTLAWLGGAELVLAASVCWITLRKTTLAAADSPLDLVHVNLVALSLAAMAWVWIERRWVVRRAPTGVRPIAPFHNSVAAITAAAVTLLAGLGLAQYTTGVRFGGLAATGWAAWGAAVALVTICWLRAGLQQGLAALYALGLAGALRVVTDAGVPARELTFALALAVSGYLLVTVLIWRLTRGRHVPPAPNELASASYVLGVVSLALAVYVALTDVQTVHRVIILAVPLLCAAAAILLSPGLSNAIGQTCTLGCIGLCGVLATWSWIGPDYPQVWLLRACGLIAIVAGIHVACAVARWRIPPVEAPVARGESVWDTAIARCFKGASGLAAAALACLAGVEIVILAGHESVQAPAWSIATMIGSLAVIIACCLLFAVRERLDPLAMAVQGREAYVWVAEVLAAVIGLHIRVTMPWLFTGLIMQYWPMLVLGIAFLALGIAEVCERRKLIVLARPLARTGAALPVLTLADGIFSASRVHFSIVLLTAGALYAALAGLKRSKTFAAAAGLAFNGSLWYLLHHTPGLAITQHPQLWLIPPALAVLVAGHLNRSRLNEAQQRSLHYACLLAIYLSSTADIFLIGVARAPWLPLILALLSVIGVLAGFASRIRSFLTLGTGFLCLALLTMIWHAAMDLGWTWMWYVAGIALGVLLITVFALFEKKRSEMTAWIEQFKSWSE